MNITKTGPKISKTEIKITKIMDKITKTQTKITARISTAMFKFKTGIKITANM